ncbi:putative reverse transcriptase domain-containing protein [Tanacetum coccineum]
MQETTEKIVQIKERLKTARSHQKSYADKRRKPLELKVGDRVLLKVSPWKGVVRFGKKGKLAPRYVGPFEIVECVGPMAYRLKLPQELSYVHNTFHVSNLKKFLAEPDVQVPLDEIEIDENLRFVEEPTEIVERDVKNLKRRRIYMFRHLKTSFMSRKDFIDITDGVHATLKKVVPPMIYHNTNDFMKNNLPRAIAKAIHPIVTIPLLPDFRGVTDGTRAKNPSSLSDIHARVFPDPYLLFRLRFKKKSVLRGCTLVLCNHVFKIDLLPTRLGGFNVIIGMDWLSYHRALIDCYEKIVHIPLPNGKILKVQCERPEKDLRSLACIKADEKTLDDIHVVRDFPKVFPDDLLGLPLVREIEFRIDLILGALPVVRSPYRLAPSEMFELSNQLKELQEKGFIRPSHSPWGAPVLFVKKKEKIYRRARLELDTGTLSSQSCHLG